MNTSSKISCLPALFIALLLCLLPATGMADTANALKFYEQAKQAYGAGDYREAADLLERAYAEDPDLIYQYNRIRALEANRDYEQALKVLNIYKGPMMRDKDKRFEDVEQIEANLKKSIDAQNGKDPVKDPEKDPEKDPVKDPDKDPEKDPDKDPDKDPEKGPDVDPEGPGTTEETGPSGRKIAAFSLIGAGAVGLGVGTLFSTGVLIPEDDAIRDTQGRIDTTSVKFKRHRAAAIGGLAGGAALAGVGVVLLVTDKSGKKDASSRNLLVTPMLGPDRAGAGLILRF
jgi:hypothetical protein